VQTDVKTTNFEVESRPGPIVRRRWSVTMPNGTMRSGTGDIPAELQAILEAQRTAGLLQTQTKWTVTLPDGEIRSGVGEIPADLKVKGVGLGRVVRKVR
jgi:hypothetical protein